MRTDLKFVVDCYGNDCMFAVEDVSSIPEKRELVHINGDKYQVVERSFEYLDKYNCIVWIMIREIG